MIKIGYFLGIDGGGTKTAFAICDKSGQIINMIETRSTSYRQYGHDGMLKTLNEGVLKVLEGCNLTTENLDGICFGMPCYGESKKDDIVAQHNISAYFKGIPIKLCNDAEVAWAGSLALNEGINIVAGTGAIAFGRDKFMNTARTGGWSEYIGDEGSGYWLGRKLLELFTKQSDGRLAKGPIYDLVHEYFSLNNDFEIINAAEKEYVHKRDKMASLQMILYNAAVSGDQYAVSAYKEAASELALAVIGVKNSLSFDNNVTVSYSGGIFKTGSLILNTFSNIINKDGCTLTAPKLEPYKGALLLAVENFGAEYLEQIKNVFLKI